jgi:lactosylceramide 4-alpha-galactosyltransferase
MNPDRQIYVLITAPVNFLDYPANDFVRALQTYPNIHFKYFDVIEITKGTPLNEWIHNATLFQSYFLNVHVSDVFRLVVLWRYQGIYLDLDMLVLHNFNSTPENLVCVESEENHQIGTAIFKVQGKLGREIIELCLK